MFTIVFLTIFYLFCPLGLCESYEWVINVCEAIQSAFEKLDSDHLSRFGLNWMTVNMHTFYSIIFTDPDVQDYLAICTAKVSYLIIRCEFIYKF